MHELTYRTTGSTIELGARHRIGIGDRPRMAKKLNPQQEREVIPRWRSLIGYLLLPPSEVDHGVRSVKDECLSKVILFGDRSPWAVNCSLMPRRCAAQERCDAASGWVDFCAITIKRPRESSRHVGRGLRLALYAKFMYCL